jgi:predicted ABC-type transport system involved in lysophospholipase L1 biosynthesis ATPase subunit
MDANESVSQLGPVLRTHALGKEYGQGAGLVCALDGVELEVTAGETLAVMGPSGCGKSTLLHLLGGLERPSAGEVWLAGRRIDTFGLSSGSGQQARVPAPLISLHETGTAKFAAAADAIGLPHP